MSAIDVRRDVAAEVLTLEPGSVPAFQHAGRREPAGADTRPRRPGAFSGADTPARRVPAGGVPAPG
jgi:hypothetical protein